MAITRVTIDLNDVPDKGTQTMPPTSLTGEREVLQKSREETDTPQRQADYQEALDYAKPHDLPIRSETVGRTPADLIFAFINRPEFMATALTFLSFIPFMGSLDNFIDFGFPILTAFILNFVWFGVRSLRAITGRFSIREEK